MRFSGNNILLLPGVQQLNFFIENIVVQTTCLSTISFCDTAHNTYAFNISGNRVGRSSQYNTSNISTYNTNENFSISGFSNLTPTGANNYINYYVNNINVQDNLVNQTLPFYALNINVASGDELDCDITMLASDINYSFVFEPNYEANSNLTGYLTSDTSFWVFTSSLQFIGSWSNLLSGTPITAQVAPNAPLAISLQDVDDSTQEYVVDFQLALDSAIGTLNTNVSANRTGILDNSFTYLFEDLNNNDIVSGQFNGDWSGNAFIYQDTPQYLSLSYYYAIRDGNGNPISDNVSFNLTPINPLNSGTYIASYITGFALTNSGEYLQPPTAIFSEYFYVTGIQQSLQSLLFSNGCSGNLPVSFSNVNGTGAGASGYLVLAPILLNNIYQVGVNQYYVAQAYISLSGGSGYTLPPNAQVNTGIYSNCYDVPSHYGSNQALFTPFNTVGATAVEAGYLTGEVLVTTGIVGGGATGYLVTGIEIDNIGSGYNSILVPTITFVRQAGDTQTVNASGIFSMKSTGMYNFPAVWSMSTGYANQSLTPITGFSGVMFISSTTNFFTIQVGLSGLDNTQPVYAQLAVTPSLTTGVVDIITGAKFFSTNPLALKKNINVEETIIPPTADLSFLLTQTQLDEFYSSPAYQGNGIDIGDLNF